MTMVLEPLKRVFGNAWRWWGEDQVPRLSAAFTFYAMLALAPMLLLAVAVAGFVFWGEQSARANIIESIRNNMGETQANFLLNMLKTHSPQTGVVATIVGIGILLFGASGLTEQLRDSVNAIWGLPAPKTGFIGVIRRKAVAIIAVVGTTAVLTGWLFLDATLQYLSRYGGDAATVFWQALSFLASWAFLSLVLALMFKYLPRKTIMWRDVMFAAVFTGLTLSVGKYLLGLYFAFASVSAAYGTAGALVVILLWFFYSAQIFFFGVELSNAYAYEMGSLKGQPHDHEMKVTATGQVTECPDGEPGSKDTGGREEGRTGGAGETEKRGVGEAVYLHDADVPAPSLTSSLAGLGQSLGHLGKSFADLGKSIKGQKR